MDDEKCPKCNTEMDTVHIGDANGGDVLVSVSVEYCPECLYIGYDKVTLSK